MRPGADRGVGRRWLLFLGLALVVVGAALMDVAGRSRSALWWDVSGAFAFAGLLVGVIYLLLSEGPRGRAR